MEPEIFINFKHYENAVGKGAEQLLNEFQTVNKKNYYYCLSYMDLYLKSKFNDMNIFSQSLDSNGYGAFTGSISMDSLIDFHIHGSLLNHSEKRVKGEDIINTVNNSKKKGFTIVLCVENIEEVKDYAKLAPSYIAYEPPNLIGGNVSVSSAKPDIIEEAAKICEHYDVNLLVGAGVKTRLDLEKSMELGASGVLIASGIIRDPKPINKLNSLTNLQ